MLETLQGSYFFVCGDAVDPIIRRADGVPVIDVAGHNFVLDTDDAPDTVHPSLWRHAQVNQPHGLFEVTAGIYHRCAGWICRT
ncbi:hypothetical protein R8Z57_01325 [Microbacterium sp. M3]|uniref:Uncharacterized protein n=1 Tax=Microbacterium arthrosphaerae TaxID=792652 RepID=A0ABU4GWG9_9MICO|nr:MULTISPECIES: hypothetical protein [Microbacterium]MDW4571413.1 hypothetical protein [Microbacterium arthrosphaerae]MDW7605268.1 hypothetical protein [Microbacterium sp. M3]